jgi:5-methylcytosine-specific restriction protein A
MKFDPEISSVEILSNKEICDIFLCSPQGGMRKSKRTNSLVLISNHTKSLYEDRWLEDVFHYTGMGQVGDQNLYFGQNKTLYESPNNKIKVFLFEVFNPQEYIFQGEVQLAGKPYQETQLDINGKKRKVWIFPLKLVGNRNMKPIDYEQFKIMQKKRATLGKRLSMEELKKRAENPCGTSGHIKVSKQQYMRDPYVAEFVRRRANGICDLCNQPAPFERKYGDPFLEIHHIQWLSRGGKDIIKNAVALCPNCHRKMHILDLKKDREKLLDKVNNIE